MVTNSGFKRTVCANEWVILQLQEDNVDFNDGCCPAGSYVSSPEENPFSVAKSCQLCPVGFTGAPVDNDDTSCTKCVAGRSTNGSVSCTLCPAGKHVDGDIWPFYCSECLEGRFQPSMEEASCTACPHGRTSFTGASVCRTCSTGRTNVPKVGSDANDYTCNKCESGSVAQAGDKECKSCDPGLYQSESGKGLCEPCEKGNFSESGASSCTSCSHGEFSPKSASSCSGCIIGQYGKAKGHCEKCPLNMYQDEEGQQNCKICFLGKITNKQGKNYL